MRRPTIEFCGSHGTLFVDPTTGEVLEYIYRVDDEPQYHDIARVDLEEFRTWAQQHADVLGANYVKVGGCYDIVDVGFWTTTGEYEEAVHDHRGLAVAPVASPADFPF